VSFAVPIGLAAAALAVPLALWYVLRARRPRLEVPSTFLWARTDRAVAAAVPWQRFRPDRTFWLVLLALLVGAVALARPTVRVPAEIGDHTIFVVDVSASMLADEGGPTRLELARRAAESLVDRIGPGQLVSVVEAGPRARVLLSASDDPAAAVRALGATRGSHGAADLADAFTLATALQRPGQQTVTHLLTDGVVAPDAARLAPPGLLVDAVGEDRPNLAVTRLQAVPTGAGAATVFAQVRNFGPLEVDARLVLAVDDADVMERQIALPPRGTEDLVVPVAYRADADGGLLRATVEPVGEDVTGASATDALAVDDRAWAVLATPREVHALVVGSGNVFLESALGSVPGVEVATSNGVPEDLSGVDLLVVDRIAAPAEARVPTLYVAPSQPPTGVTVTGELELPALTFSDPASELLADVDLSQAAFAAGQAVAAPALQAIASGPSGPLVLAGRLGPVPVVYLAFDLLQTNLPLQVAWPVFVANAVAWLAGPPATAPATAGTEATLTVPPGATGLEVTPPGGEPVRLDAVSPQVRVDQVGVWTVAYTGPEDVVDRLPAPRPIAVNPDPAEGDLARGRPEAAAPAGTPGADPAQPEPAEGRRVFGRELLAAVLVLLLLEWAWTHGVRPLRWLRGRRSRRVAGAVAPRGRGPDRSAHRERADVR